MRTKLLISFIAALLMLPSADFESMTRAHAGIKMQAQALAEARLAGETSNDFMTL